MCYFLKQLVACFVCHSKAKLKHFVLSGGDYGGHDFGGELSGGQDFGGGVDASEHHHQKTVTVVKNVPVPYHVTKEIPFPVEKVVHVAVKVPVPQPYPVEKKVSFTYQ